MIRSLALAAAVALGVTTLMPATPAKADIDIYIDVEVPKDYERTKSGWKRKDGKWYKLTCDQARRILRKKEWEDIRVKDCTGRHYRFTAIRFGARRNLIVDSRTGEVTRL